MMECYITTGNKVPLVLNMRKCRIITLLRKLPIHNDGPEFFKKLHEKYRKMYKVFHFV